MLDNGGFFSQLLHSTIAGFYRCRALRAKPTDGSIKVSSRHRAPGSLYLPSHPRAASSTGIHSEKPPTRKLSVSPTLSAPDCLFLVSEHPLVDWTNLPQPWGYFSQIYVFAGIATVTYRIRPQNLQRTTCLGIFFYHSSVRSARKRRTLNPRTTTIFFSFTFKRKRRIYSTSR